jgi:hypothetical protein
MNNLLIKLFKRMPQILLLKQIKIKLQMNQSLLIKNCQM